MSRTSIIFNFNQAINKANQLNDIAEDLNKLAARDCEGTLQSLSNSWKGENAITYIKKGEELQKDIMATATQIRMTASTIKSVATNIYNAEMEALRIAEEREALARAAQLAELDKKKQKNI